MITRRGDTPSRSFRITVHLPDCVDLMRKETSRHCHNSASSEWRVSEPCTGHDFVDLIKKVNALSVPSLVHERLVMIACCVSVPCLVHESLTSAY